LRAKFKSFCGECFRIATSEWKESDEVRRILMARGEKTWDMLQRVGQLKLSEQVPIHYAVEKLSNEVESVGKETHSPRWYKTFILRHLRNELHIKKVRNKYVCDRERVDVTVARIYGNPPMISLK